MEEMTLKQKFSRLAELQEEMNSICSSLNEQELKDQEFTAEGLEFLKQDVYRMRGRLWQVVGYKMRFEIPNL